MNSNSNDLNQIGKYQYFSVNGAYNVGEKQGGSFVWVVIGLRKNQAVKVCELLNAK
jgi:hypothetical protein